MLKNDRRTMIILNMQNSNITEEKYYDLSQQAGLVASSSLQL